MAETLAREAAETLAKTLGAGHPDVVRTRRGLCELTGSGEFVSIEAPVSTTAGGTLRITIIAIERKSLRPTRLKADGTLVARTLTGDTAAVQTNRASPYFVVAAGKSGLVQRTESWEPSVGTVRNGQLVYDKGAEVVYEGLARPPTCIRLLCLDELHHEEMSAKPPPLVRRCDMDSFIGGGEIDLDRERALALMSSKSELQPNPAVDATAATGRKTNEQWDEEVRLRQLFRSIDADGSGELDRKEGEPAESRAASSFGSLL